MYRAIRALQVGSAFIQKGEIGTFDQLNPGALRRLLDMGLIVVVSPPPLKVLPKWAGRAAKLEAIGVITAADFLTAEDRQLAQTLRIGAAQVATFKQELRASLRAPQG